jgi:hypothetical protein
MRCSEPALAPWFAIVASRGPGRGAWVVGCRREQLQIIVKTILVTVLLVVVALSSAYAFGRYRGAQSERQLWESTREVSQHEEHSTGRPRFRTRMIYTSPHDRPVAVERN